MREKVRHVDVEKVEFPLVGFIEHKDQLFSCLDLEESAKSQMPQTGLSVSQVKKREVKTEDSWMIHTQKAQE